MNKKKKTRKLKPFGQYPLQLPPLLKEQAL